MSRVLVTGASGFIGRRTLAPLVAAGHEVHGVSRDARAHPDAPTAVAWHAADLLDSARVVDEVRPDVLVHLAWYAEHGKFWNSPENVRWVEASLRLLRAFADGGGRRAVVAGTCAEYDWAAGEPVLREEVSPLRPTTLYGAAKHALHQVAAAYAGEAGFALAWGRVFFLYGPDEAPGRLFAAVARALLGGERARTTAGAQIRDFLHVADVGAAFAALASSDVTGAVNVASGQAVAVRDVIQAIARETGRADLLDLGAQAVREGEPDVLVADTTRLREEVGFSPSRTLDEGIAASVRALRAEVGG